MQAHNLRRTITKAFREKMRLELKELYDPNIFSVQIKSILDGYRNPVKIKFNKLPAIFFGYGDARLNNSIQTTTNSRGETVSLILYAVVNEIKGDDGRILKDDEGYPIGDKVSRAADMHDTLELFVKGIQHIGDTKVRKTRLASVRTLGGKLSDREFLEFRIELDITYKVFN